ncbi:WYL domain-containing protein [Aliidiomarina indica]|uniref:WYL domain-containing protein n=1 Tax=Aliidiomarina indica TaxID=2749147 RepID=UPI00188ECF25|nr:WYL domain-containing protein [Aliidiomarina indica]
MLENLSFAQRQRLAYIDFSLLFKGSIYRNDLVQRFSVGLSAGTRDFNLYKELAPNNLYYDSQEKRYFQAETFAPIFQHDPKRTLIKLANDISDGFDAIGDTHFPVEAPSSLNVPDVFIVARMVQSTLNGKAVLVRYTSLSSGENERELVPHSIVDNGLRWHVRAFDRKSQSFRDFVLTRIHEVHILDDADTFEEAEADHEWQRMIPLQLVPHPHNVKHKAAIEMDYGMVSGLLTINVRAAMAGYLLRRWNVDCTEDGTLEGHEYQLWLRNRVSLVNTNNLAVAPGYAVIE